VLGAGGQTRAARIALAHVARAAEVVVGAAHGDAGAVVQAAAAGVAGVDGARVGVGAVDGRAPARAALARVRVCARVAVVAGRAVGLARVHAGAAIVAGRAGGNVALIGRAARRVAAHLAHAVRVLAVAVVLAVGAVLGLAGAAAHVGVARVADT